MVEEIENKNVLFITWIINPVFRTRKKKKVLKYTRRLHKLCL